MDFQMLVSEVIMDAARGLADNSIEEVMQPSGSKLPSTSNHYPAENPLSKPTRTGQTP
jgi:hypothetical protein